MDISYHHKLGSTNWDNSQPYNLAMEAHNMLDHHHHHHHEINPFEQLWPNYPPLHPNQPQPSISSPTHLLPPPPNEGGEEDHHFKFEIGDQEDAEGEDEELGAMKEMIFKIASMQPVDIDPATVRKPKRRNVRISDDPQSVAARHRRERISEKIRILQRLVPGGTKMDTASMLDEAIRYVKFLKRQIRTLQDNNCYQQPPGAVGPASAQAKDHDSWLSTGTTSYNLFGGNNVVNDGPISHDGPIFFNHKFIGHD